MTVPKGSSEIFRTLKDSSVRTGGAVESRMSGLAYALALVTGLGLAQCLAGWILVTRFARQATTRPAQLPPRYFEAALR
jgi:hypothetical protein